MISYQDFCRLLADTTGFKILDAYVAECGGSVNVAPVGATIKLLEIIWQLGHDGLSIESILHTGGLTAAQLAREYSISYKTVHHWASGVRAPSAWALSLLAYAVMCSVCADLCV